MERIRKNNNKIILEISSQEKDIEEKNPFGLPDIGIPAEILFHPALSAREKILFGFLRNLAQSSKGCWASNRYLGELTGVKPQSISNTIQKLAKLEYILVQYEIRSNGNQIRRIFINPEYPKIYCKMVQQAHDNMDTSLLKKLYPPILKKLSVPIKTDINPYYGVNTKVVIKEEIEKERISPSIIFPKHTMWEALSKKYGRNHVQLIHSFLLHQQKNFPNRIKGEISPTHERVLSSLVVLDKLCRLDGYNFETEIKPALSQVPKDKFWARNLLSLASLRNKSKNGETKFVNLLSTLQIEKKMPESIINKSPISPESIIQSHFEDYTHWIKYILSPTIAMFGNGDGVNLATNICKTHDWFVQKQNSLPLPPIDKGDFMVWAEMIPGPLKFMERYLQWIDKQDWLSEKSSNLFSPDSKVLHRFIREYQKEIGFDIFTGKRI